MTLIMMIVINYYCGSCSKKVFKVIDGLNYLLVGVYAFYVYDR